MHPANRLRSSRALRNPRWLRTRGPAGTERSTISSPRLSLLARVAPRMQARGAGINCDLKSSEFPSFVAEPRRPY